MWKKGDEQEPIMATAGGTHLEKGEKAFPGLASLPIQLLPCDLP